jgi:hypothetical protein
MKAMKKFMHLLKQKHAVTTSFIKVKYEIQIKWVNEEHTTKSWPFFLASTRGLHSTSGFPY